MKYAMKLASLWFVRVDSIGFSPIGGIMKRCFDIFGAVVGLVFLGPLFAMIAALIKVTDGGSVLYGHTRIGHNGDEFKCLKFRTMVPDADTVLREHLRRNPDDMIEWTTTRKLKNDPRITRVGTVLRKLSLDELPQLANVLRGEMSLVGPRPVVDDELALYGRSAAYYLKARPGLTGLWQISGRNDVSYDARVAFDREYVENWSLTSDMWIIVRTVPAVCAQQGSY